MNLFEKLYEDERLHPNFLSIMPDAYAPERDVLNDWTDSFPDRDNKFVKEFQTTFNSCFWELYLYQLFREVGCEFNWDFPSPDFALEKDGVEFIVEATVSSNAEGDRAEWDKDFASLSELYDDYLETMNEKNEYSIIRLANSFFSKFGKFDKTYSKHDHVKDKPFVLAISANEQPLHYHQYDRPMMALLYDFYVDEEEYTKHPERYPDGPPDRSLEYVEKPNGATISLGVFLNDKAADISAVLFNPLASFGKVTNMADKLGATSHIWITDENKPLQTINEKERIEDGLFIFHNPYAKHPLPRELFARERVCQVFMDKKTLRIDKQYGSKHLTQRTAFGINVVSDEEFDRSIDNGNI